MFFFNRLYNLLSQKKENEISIGNQIWMNENLKTSTFRNGDELKYIKTIDDWNHSILNKEPGYCFYNNVYENGEKKGYLYNWYAINDKRGLAPQGWKIPEITDFQHLIQALDPSEQLILLDKNDEKGIYLINYSEKIKGMLIVNSEWAGYSIEKLNTESVFKATPSGCRSYWLGAGEDGFNYENVMAFWWCRNEFNEKNAYFFNINDVCVELKSESKDLFFSVRVIKESNNKP